MVSIGVVLAKVTKMPCGRDCSCCDFGDGTAPCDHESDCDLVKGGWGRDPECSCEGALQKAVERAKEDSLQEWECSVIHVAEDSFTAILRDVEGAPPLLATVPKKEVSEEDHSWIVMGAIFDWYVSPFSSKISFRKSVWTKEEIDEMKAKGEEMYKLFGLKESDE